MAELGHADLLVTASTLGLPDFETLVRAAAAGGFAGLSLWPRETYGRARESGLTDAELRSMLSDHGLVVNDVDALFCFVGEGDPGPWVKAGPSEQVMGEAAEALGARFINVVMMSDGPIDVDRAAELFAGVCDRVGEHGLTAHLEFVPFMAVPDLATAWQVVERAGRPEAGIMVDTWHCFRGSTDIETLLEIPGERLLGVQVNDAPREPLPNPVDETMHHRLVPGEGDIDLGRFLRILDEAGCPAPLTVEVFNDRLLEQYEPIELAKHLGEAMRTVRAEAMA